MPVSPIEEMEAGAIARNGSPMARPLLREGAYRSAWAHVTIKDGAAYGVILTQGYGTLGKNAVSTPSMIRFGEHDRG